MCLLGALPLPLLLQQPCVLAAAPADVLVYDEVGELDTVPAAGTPAKSMGRVPAWKRLLWEGGHPADAFLTAASAQVRALLRASGHMRS